MEDNFGLLGMLAVLMVLSILRGYYGRINSTKAHLEEFFTTMFLICFVVAFSLVVGRSPEGRQRYQNDMDLYIPIQNKSEPATPASISRQLSSISKATPDNCSTCHTGKSWDTFKSATALIVKDFEANGTAFNMALKPLHNQAANHSIVIRSIPNSGPPESGWKKIKSWFSSGQRALKTLNDKAVQAESSRRSLEERIRDIQEHYGFEQYQQTVNRHLSFYATAERSGNTALAAYHMLQASAANSRFYASLAKSGLLAIKARHAMFMLNWGAWVIVIVSLITRYSIRRLNPEASWFIYPGITACWGFGVCLMMDYSLNYLLRLRFIGFYAWRDVLLCHLVFISIALLFKPNWFKAALKRTLNVARRAWLLLFVLLFTVMAFSCLFVPAHVASEIFKLLLVVFFAWYAIFRGDYIARRTQGAGFIHNISDPAWLRENMLAFILITGAGSIAFVYLHDFGPLLVIMILFIAYIWLLMGVGTLVMASTVVAIFGGAAYHFRNYLGQRSIFAHIYERFSEMYDPFHLGSGELSKLLWLRRSAGLTGYPYGNIPYFGHYMTTDIEMLVTPAQLQSDYSTSHIFAQLGYPLGILFMVLYFIWFLKIFIDSGQMATRLEASDSSRFIGWFLALASLLLLIQGVLTTAGGFTVVPLTGITLPLISYGTTSAIMTSVVIATFYAKEEVL
ncbi:MAG: FtsW/RodA/SpoVE family cell cycle protein [Desulfuromonadaceae bacterium]